MPMRIAAFPDVVFRVPCFAFNAEQVESLVASPLFDEALLLASSDLYAEKIKAEQKGCAGDDRKLRIALNKYASRAMTRPTPFGLFAGCSMAAMGGHSDVFLSDKATYQRCTRLDMHYVCALVQHLEKKEVVRQQLLYYANDSLYEFGGRLRYVEYYYRGTKRVHRLSGVETSDYTRCILNAAKQGATVELLASLVVDDEISVKEAIEFVDELIENQLLKSELEIGVTGTNPLQWLIRRLNEMEGVGDIEKSLQTIDSLLGDIDSSPLGASITLYDQVIEQVRALGVSYEPRFLLQTDLFKPAPHATVSQATVQSVLAGLTFLNKITPKPKETNITKFKEAFYSRYEERTVPLMEALDKELGIGYPIGRNDGDHTPLISGMVLPEAARESATALNAWAQLLLRKHVAAVQEKQPYIILSDEDVKGLKADWSDLPPSFSCICELLNNDTIRIKSAGGSAAKLFGRFCHLSNDIETHVRAIVEKEQALNPEVIYAEVVHLPESRIGNILYRPVLREYEIPYLCNPGTDQEHVIALADLMLCVRQGRLVLSSEKLKKEIVPCLSTAHNYHYNSMPVYHFLCDMQHPVGRSGVFFSWGGVAELFDYLPRVVYRNCILSRARWIIKKDRLQAWTKLEEDVLIDTIAAYRDAEGIPERVVVPDGDNELFIDFTNPLSVLTLLEMAKKRNGMVIEEFLFEEKEAVVTSKEGAFCNEFIFAFHQVAEGGAI